MISPPTKHTARNGITPTAGTFGTPPRSKQDSATPLFGDTPTFPDNVYDGLPEILKEGCDAFSEQREKDVFLLSAIVILSGCMSSVWGNYDGAEIKANLFAFVIAPPGSGKSALSWARMLGVGIHKGRIEESERQKKEYDIKAAEAKVERQPFIEHPPPYKCLFIPGNTSSAAIIKALKDNCNNGIICETEADSLSGALKQDWGDFSDVLRKAFHHENVSSLRKTGERYEIENPALAVILAGTPGQVGKLIPNAENGLFSRFLFYRFENEPQWRDVSPVSGRSSLNQQFGRLAERVKSMALVLERSASVEFSLTDSQWRTFNHFCNDWLNQSIDDTAKAISSTIFRLGVIIYRMAMVLFVVRCYERNELSSQSIICDDQSFTTALRLAKVLLEHSKLMFDIMPKPDVSVSRKSNRQKFLENLPQSFSRETANVIGKKLSVTERTVTNYLDRLTALGQLLKENHGNYQKQ